MTTRRTCHATLTVLILSVLACTAASEESISDIFNAPVTLQELDADLSPDSDVPNWDYPDIQLADG